MIYFYTGTPGSGKSYHTAELIHEEMRKGKNIISNFEVNEKMIIPKNKKELGKFVYVTNYELMENKNIYKKNPLPYNKYAHIESLKNYALTFHLRDDMGRITEHQTWLIIDECQELFNSRTWQTKDRLEWCSFFRQHRKYGYDVILVSQDEKCIDKQIRNVIEYIVQHRKVNNFGRLGKIVGKIVGGDIFSYTTKWAGVNKKDNKTESKMVIGKKFIYDFYDSYKIFEIKS